MSLPEPLQGYHWVVSRVEGKEELKVALVRAFDSEGKWGTQNFEAGFRHVSTSGVYFFDALSEARLSEAVDAAAQGILNTLKRNAYLDGLVETICPS